MDSESNIPPGFGDLEPSTEFRAAIGMDDHRSLREILLGPVRPKRKNKVTPEGLAALRAANARNKPWLLDRRVSPEGKLIQRLCKIKHGLYSALVSEQERRGYANLMEKLRAQECRLGGRPVDRKILAKRDEYAVRLNYARNVAEISAVELARKADVDPRTILHAEQSTTTVTAKTAAKIARALAEMGVEV
jgi:DNA-binding XRE family transcriptional regulator